MIRAALAIALLGLAASAEAREPLVRVPFVGCPSDGQVGPMAAPKSGDSPRLRKALASQLAYYASADGPAVLAPRGWHCVGLYGSAGATLIVTPTRHKADDFFRDHVPSLLGPVVQADTSYGGTSGRYSVARAIARYFPARRDFVLQVIDMDRTIGALKFEPLPKAPYPADVVRRETRISIRFTTPAHRNGEGTNSWLAADNEPIEGIRGLSEGADGPDLYGIDVRLPSRQAHLIEAILSEGAE